MLYERFQSRHQVDSNLLNGALRRLRHEQRAVRRNIDSVGSGDGDGEVTPFGAVLLEMASTAQGA